VRSAIIEDKFELYEDGRLFRLRKDGARREIKPVYNGKGTNATVRFNYKTHSLIELLKQCFLDTAKDYLVYDASKPISVENLVQAEWGVGENIVLVEFSGKVYARNIIVNDEGKILNTISRAVTTGVTTPKGYKQYMHNGKSLLVHRMVAELYIDNPDNKQTVNHRNENKEDNRVENLEWMTLSDNVKEYYNLREHRLLTKVKEQREELSKIRKELQTERKETIRLLKLLEKKEKQLDKLKEQQIKVATMQNLAVMTHQPYIQRVKQAGNSTLVGKPVKVNGKQFDSIHAASQYIASKEPGKRVSTIRKEIRKFVKGERLEWKMYGKYYISL